MAVKRESAIDWVRRQQRGWTEGQRRKNPAAVMYGLGAKKVLTDRQRGAVSPLGGQAKRGPQGRRGT